MRLGKQGRGLLWIVGGIAIVRRLVEEAVVGAGVMQFVAWG